jgi:hypothetical protein
MRALPALALLPLGTLLTLAACEPDRKVLPSVAASDAAFLSTSFAACDEEVGSNPSPRSVDGASLATVLHGTWVAQRTVRNGRSQYPALVPGREPNAHHILVLDTRAGVGLQYEERGPAVAANAFAQMLPAPAGAMGITYLHCGGAQFGAFRDQYVKVSDDPAAGLYPHPRRQPGHGRPLPLRLHGAGAAGGDHAERRPLGHGGRVPRLPSQVRPRPAGHGDGGRRVPGGEHGAGRLPGGR